MITQIISRREALAASLALASRSASADANKDKPPVIDTHTHFYDPTRKEGVPWPGKDNKALYRTVLPAEYQKLAKPHGITGTVVVEASPWLEDNQWLLDVAKDEPFLLGVVGNLPLNNEDFARNLERFAKNSVFRGIRVNSGAVAIAIKTPEQFDRLKLLSDNGLTLDINGGPDSLHHAATLSEKLPKLRVVMNHMGNPVIDGKEPPEAWRSAVKAAGDAGENVFCKLSALVEGSRKRDGKAPKDLAFYTPTLDHLFKAFGPNRLIFGSNWPVSNTFASFDTVYELASQYVKSKGGDAFVKVFGRNAGMAYRLKPRI